jgi:hypothetical protein
MKADRCLYLVSSQRGVAGCAVGASRSHLRLVRGALAGDEDAPLTRSGPLSRRWAASEPLSRRWAARLPLPRRSLSRPFARRMIQAASDVAVLAVALIVGLRPSA